MHTEEIHGAEQTNRLSQISFIWLIINVLLSIIVQSEWVNHFTTLSVLLLPYLWLSLLIYNLIIFSFSLSSKSLINVSVLVVNILLTLWFVPISWLFRPEVQLPSQPTLSILTWNVQRMGETHKNPKRKRELSKRLHCIRDAVQVEKPDVMTFQEISMNRMHRLEKVLNLACKFVSYYNNGGTHRGGIATCVPRQGRWYISGIDQIDLSDEQNWYALFTELSHRNRADTPIPPVNVLNVHFTPPSEIKKRRRGAQLSRVNSSKGSLLRRFTTNVSTLTETMKAQKKQGTKLTQIIKGFKDPTIIAGDFNAPPNAPVHQLFKDEWIDAWSKRGVTFGVTRWFGWIPMRIDLIYALARRFHIGSTRTLDAQCSDHKALKAIFSLKQNTLQADID